MSHEGPSGLTSPERGDYGATSTERGDYGATSPERGDYGATSADRKPRVILTLNEIYDKIGFGNAQIFYWTVLCMISVSDTIEQVLLQIDEEEAEASGVQLRGMLSQAEIDSLWDTVVEPKCVCCGDMLNEAVANSLLLMCPKCRKAKESVKTQISKFKGKGKGKKRVKVQSVAWQEDPMWLEIWNGESSKKKKKPVVVKMTALPVQRISILDDFALPLKKDTRFKKKSSTSIPALDSSPPQPREKNSSNTKLKIKKKKPEPTSPSELVRTITQEVLCAKVRVEDPEVSSAKERVEDPEVLNAKEKVADPEVFYATERVPPPPPPPRQVERAPPPPPRRSVEAERAPPPPPRRPVEAERAPPPPPPRSVERVPPPPPTPLSIPLRPPPPTPYFTGHELASLRLDSMRPLMTEFPASAQWDILARCNTSPGVTSYNSFLHRLLSVSYAEGVRTLALQFVHEMGELERSYRKTLQEGLTDKNKEDILLSAPTSRYGAIMTYKTVRRRNILILHERHMALRGAMYVITRDNPQPSFNNLEVALRYAADLILVGQYRG